MKDGLYSQCKDCRKIFYLKNLDKIEKYKEQIREKRYT